MREPSQPVPFTETISSPTATAPAASPPSVTLDTIVAPPATRQCLESRGRGGGERKRGGRGGGGGGWGWGWGGATDQSRSRAVGREIVARLGVTGRRPRSPPRLLPLLLLLLLGEHSERAAAPRRSRRRERDQRPGSTETAVRVRFLGTGGRDFLSMSRSTWSRSTSRRTTPCGRCPRSQHRQWPRLRHRPSISRPRVCRQ